MTPRRVMPGRRFDAAPVLERAPIVHRATRLAVDASVSTRPTAKSS
jgi:hypothetical protein